MPELPEVETVKRILSPQLCGRTIAKLTVNHPAVLAHPEAETFCSAVPSSSIRELDRRGKYLLIRLDGGVSIVVHLRMTGQLLVTPSHRPLMPHTHVIFHLDNEDELRFIDTRRFGRLWLLREAELDTFTGIHKLGPEPFDPSCNAAYLEQTLGRRRIPIKQALLDQTVIAGIGNIYADETLFQAKLHPSRIANTITKQEWRRLAKLIPEILAKAIVDNDMTAEEYLAGEGQEYRNTPLFQVYGRKGENCLHCGAVIERIKIGGRSSSYCPRCQKIPRGRQSAPIRNRTGEQ